MKVPTKAEYRRAADLREAIRTFLRKSERIAPGHGLTPQRYLLLLFVKTARDGSERCSLTELVERMQLAASTVTELVHRAEDTGLVSRVLDPANRRIVYVRLTADGEHRLAGAVRELGPERRRLVALLTALGAEQ